MGNVYVNMTEENPLNEFRDNLCTSYEKPTWDIAHTVRDIGLNQADKT